MRASLLFLFLFLFLFAQDSFPRKFDLVAFQADHFHHHLIAFLQHVSNVSDAALVDFGNMKQAVGAREDFDEGAEIRDANDFAAIRLAHFRCGRQVGDDLNRLIGGGAVVGCNIDPSVIGDERYRLWPQDPAVKIRSQVEQFLAERGRRLK